MPENETHPTPAAIRQKLELLRQAFARDIPKRLDAIEALFARFCEAPEEAGVASDFGRACHTLAGTAASMGYSEVGGAARALESEIKALTAPSGEDFDRLRTLLEQLRECAEASPTRVRCTTIPPAHNHSRAPQRPTGSLEGPAPTPPPGQESRHVILVDDDDHFREQLSLQLQCFGYEVSDLADLTGLRSAYDAGTPSALIMDLAFPEGEIAGAEAIAKLRKVIPELPPVIFVSRHGDFRSRLEASRAGAQAYLLKPLHVRELIDHLDRLTSPAPIDPYRVLIIDDDPIAAEYHALILRERGMTTREVTDPSSSFHHLADFKPDLILLDLHMPGCNGFELARILRHIPAHVSLPIVFLSTERDRGRQLDGLLMGGDDFLTKPVDPDWLVSSVIARASRMRLLRSLMERDGLTRLYNHSTTRERLTGFIDHARRKSASLSFAMIDLDHFKKVNDTHGHHVGDAVLMVLSRLLKQRLRRTDLAGRYGGEEFAAILLDTTADTAASILDGIRTSFSQILHDSEHGEFTASFSCGIAQFPDFDDESDLVKAADQALYTAKANGRNRIAVARREAVKVSFESSDF